MRRPWELLWLIAVLACGGDDDQVACTEEFRVATVFLVDAADAPVGDATVRTRLERTGELVPVTSLMDLAPGNYGILDDNAVPLIQSEAEPFLVTAQRPAGAPVEARYTFRAPQGCHIEKVSGPDTLVVP